MIPYPRPELNRIPDITDARLAELAKVIRPMRRVDGQWHEVLVTDLRRHAFTWSEKLRPVPLHTVVERLGSIVTFHTYGAPALFKPSVAEVLAQIPEPWMKLVSGFAMWETEMDVSHVLDDGYHFARVDLYAHTFWGAL